MKLNNSNKKSKITPKSLALFSPQTLWRCLKIESKYDLMREILIQSKSQSPVRQQSYHQCFHFGLKKPSNSPLLISQLFENGEMDE
jgi:hypothetical protein